MDGGVDWWETTLLFTFTTTFGLFFDKDNLNVFLGMLLVGIFFTKLTFLYNNMIIPDVWNSFLRQTAFILILIRCAICLDPEALKKSLVYFNQ